MFMTILSECLKTTKFSTMRVVEMFEDNNDGEAVIEAGDEECEDIDEGEIAR